MLYKMLGSRLAVRNRGRLIPRAIPDLRKIKSSQGTQYNHTSPPCTSLIPYRPSLPSIQMTNEISKPLRYVPIKVNSYAPLTRYVKPKSDILPVNVLCQIGNIFDLVRLYYSMYIREYPPNKALELSFRQALMMMSIIHY